MPVRRTSDRHFQLIAAVCIVLWAVALLLMFPSARSFDQFSESLLIGSVQKAAAHGVMGAGGFLYLPSGEPYLSQFGLHYKAFALLVMPFGLRSTAVLGLLFSGIALLTWAWLMSVWLVHVRREFGRFAGGFALWWVATAAPLLQFATRSYWCIALAFAPFVYAWTRHRPQRPSITALVVGGLVLVKSLCGYEYVSSILAAAMVAVWHREREADRRGWRALRPVCLVGLAGGAAFAVALVFHFAQARYWFASNAEAVEGVLRAARYRTVGDPLGLPPPFTQDLRALVAGLFVEGQMWFFRACVVALAGEYWWSRRSHPRGTQQAWLWVGTLTAGLLASLSWNVLARGHMRHHAHLNYITFYLPYNLLVVVHAASLIGRMVTSRQGTNANLAPNARMELPHPQPSDS